MPALEELLPFLRCAVGLSACGGACGAIVESPSLGVEGFHLKKGCFGQLQVSQVVSGRASWDASPCS